MLVLLRRVNKLPARRGRVLLLVQISKPLLKRELLRLEASRVPRLLLRVSKLRARRCRVLPQLLQVSRLPASRVLLWLKSHLRLLLHRVKPPRQQCRRVPILLPKHSRALLRQPARLVRVRLP